MKVSCTLSSERPLFKIKSNCWWYFLEWYKLIMKSTLKCTQTLSKVTFYSKSDFIVDALRFCVFTLYFGLNLFKCWVVSLTDEVLLLALSSTFYSILKLQFTHYLLSLWMQRFTLFFGGFPTRLFLRCIVFFHHHRHRRHHHIFIVSYPSATRLIFFLYKIL